MNIRILVSIILSLMILGIGSGISVTASSPIHVISPVNDEVFHYGQKLVVAFQSVPNAPVAIYVLTPNGTNIPVAQGATNSSGYFSVTLWTWGTSSETSLVGQYVVEIEVNGGQIATVVPVYYQPYTATIIASVVNEQHIPISGANITVYNITNGLHKYITSVLTNISGIATIHVIAFNTTEDLEIVASSPGYVGKSAEVKIIENQTKSVAFVLYPAVVSISVVGAYIDNHLTAPNNPVGYQSVTTIEGTEVSLIAEVEYAGMKVTNATMEATITTPVNSTTMTISSPISSGMFAGDYNISFYAPILYNDTFPYMITVTINTTYNGIPSTTVVSINVQENESAIIASVENKISTLNTEIENLSKTINVLETDIANLSSSLKTLSGELNNVSQSVTSLETEISTFETKLSSLNTTVNNLGKSVSSLETQVNSLNSNISSINSKLNSLTPLVYGGLIAGIIGLIVAIVAIVLVYRKIS